MKRWRRCGKPAGRATGPPIGDRNFESCAHTVVESPFGARGLLKGGSFRILRARKVSGMASDVILYTKQESEQRV